MFQKLFLVLAAAIFLLISMLHLFRIYAHLSIVVGCYTVPMWLSYIGFPVSLGLSIWAYLIYRRSSAAA